MSVYTFATVYELQVAAMYIQDSVPILRRECGVIYKTGMPFSIVVFLWAISREVVFSLRHQSELKPAVGKTG
jgi:hypothetical protein